MARCRSTRCRPRRSRSTWPPTPRAWGRGWCARTVAELREALAGARGADGPVVVYIEADRYRGVPSYESWWDVPVAEVSEEETVRAARESYERAHAGASVSI